MRSTTRGLRRRPLSVHALRYRTLIGTAWHVVCKVKHSGRREFVRQGGSVGEARYDPCNATRSVLEGRAVQVLAAAAIVQGVAVAYGPASRRAEAPNRMLHESWEVGREGRVEL